jgi:hypothetical protein
VSERDFSRNFGEEEGTERELVIVSLEGEG